jgi:hypothetical protein
MRKTDFKFLADASFIRNKAPTTTAKLREKIKDAFCTNQSRIIAT